jgi:hypothetical protein
MRTQVTLDMSWRAAKAVAKALCRVAKHALLMPLYLTRILLTSSAAEAVVILLVVVAGLYLLRTQVTLPLFPSALSPTYVRVNLHLNAVAQASVS